MTGTVERLIVTVVLIVLSAIVVRRVVVTWRET